MKSATFNHSQSSSSQGQSITSTLAAIITTIVIVGGLVAIMSALLFGGKAVKSVGGKPATPPVDPDLAAAQQLGLDPKTLIKAEQFQQGQGSDLAAAKQLGVTPAELLEAQKLAAAAPTPIRPLSVPTHPVSANVRSFVESPTVRQIRNSPETKKLSDKVSAATAKQAAKVLEKAAA